MFAPSLEYFYETPHHRELATKNMRYYIISEDQKDKKLISDSELKQNSADSHGHQNHHHHSVVHCHHEYESAYVPNIEVIGLPGGCRHAYEPKEELPNGKEEYIKSDIISKSRISMKKSMNVAQRLPPILRNKMVEAGAQDSRKDFQKAKRSLMDWKNYHRLEVIYDFMEKLEQEFPSLCTIGIIGKSLEGREIKILKISNSEATNAGVWIDAGIHAREWIGPAVNTYIANYIARNFQELPPSMTNKDWYFAPVLNPDGYDFTHTTERMWRKNKALYRGNVVGVDLNRNFSFGWGGKGSSDVPTHCFYRGPQPFSEPESRAVRDFMLNSGVTFITYITLHSFGEVIIFPFASSDDLCPNYIRLLQGATIMAKAIYDTNGNIYKVGISKDVMYRAAGTSNDWCHGVVGIPYCYLIELRSKKHKFTLPADEIKETAGEIVNCVTSLMAHVDANPLKKKIVPNSGEGFEVYADEVEKKNACISP